MTINSTPRRSEARPDHRQPGPGTIQTRGNTMKTRKFADPIMQFMYDSMMNMSESAIAEMLRRGGSQQSAFADGYEGVPQAGIRDYRGTAVYAAWCAGRDRSHAEDLSEGKE